MIQARTFTAGHRLRFVCAAVAVVSAVTGGQPARGQVSIELVIDPSPMIAQGHLEGGINGDGNPRPDGKTPLMLAVEANDLKVIGYLLQHGADPEIKDTGGETALDLAQHHGVQAASRMLDAHASAHPGPAAYYAGKSPVLTIIGPGSQSGSPDCGAAHSLVVLVTDRDGTVLADAPVRFTVDGGGKYLLTQPSSPDSPSLLLRSDGSGQCRANCHLPKEPNARLRITASVGTGEQAPKVVFKALTNDGTGGDSASWFDPTDIHAAGSSTGDLDVSWSNHTDDETAIRILFKLRDGWKPVLTLPAHSTSAHIPAE